MLLSHQQLHPGLGAEHPSVLPPWGQGERWAPGGVPQWSAVPCQCLPAGAALSFLANPFVPSQQNPSEIQASGFTLPLVLWLASAFPGCGSPRMICLQHAAASKKQNGIFCPWSMRARWLIPSKDPALLEVCRSVINTFCLGGREGWDHSVKPKLRRGARRRLKAAPLQRGREDGACVGHCQGRERREGFKSKSGNILASLFCCSRTWNGESSATASQPQCEAEWRRWGFNADGVDALLFVPRSHFPEIPGPCLLGPGWYQA